MRRLHLETQSGLSGDMFLGACLDLGMPLEVLADAVARLGLPGVGVEARKAHRGGIAGTRFRVLEAGRPIEGPDPEEPADGGHEDRHDHDHDRRPDHDHHDHQDHQHDHAGPAQPESRVLSEPQPGGAHTGHAHEHHHGAGPHAHNHHGRGLGEIRVLITASALASPVKERSLQLFARLGEAEANVHGMPLEHVHFHEVGAVDAIVDLVGAATAVEFLGAERISATPSNAGGGAVHTAHGRLPVPAPATVELLRGIPIYGSALGEILTPTGAVLLAELVDEFGELPAMAIQASGYGLGKREIPGQPNAVRALLGTAADTNAAEVQVVECEVDDLSGEGFGFVMERLLGAGALDVYFTPLQMKKSRPGTLVTMLCRREQLDALAALLLAESGSFGCRVHAARRFEAERDVVPVETPFGTVAVKRARLGGRTIAEAPEYEDCRRLALQSGVSWREVYRAATAAFAARQRSD